VAVGFNSGGGRGEHVGLAEYPDSRTGVASDKRRQDAAQILMRIGSQ